jgi:hypothetical protein
MITLRTLPRTLALSSALATALACAPALAGGTKAADSSSAEAAYQRERAACIEGRTQQSRHDCLREAGAALQEARRHRLDNGENEQQLAANREARCQYVGTEDRADCVRMMQGEGTVDGSVEGGGLYRELVTRSVGPS